MCKQKKEAERVRREEMTETKKRRREANAATLESRPKRTKGGANGEKAAANANVVSPSVRNTRRSARLAKQQKRATRRYDGDQTP